MLVESVANISQTNRKKNCLVMEGGLWLMQTILHEETAEQKQKDQEWHL